MAQSVAFARAVRKNEGIDAGYVLQRAWAPSFKGLRRMHQGQSTLSRRVRILQNTGISASISAEVRRAAALDWQNVLARDVWHHPFSHERINMGILGEHDFNNHLILAPSRQWQNSQIPGFLLATIMLRISPAHFESLWHRHLETIRLNVIVTRLNGPKKRVRTLEHI